MSDEEQANMSDEEQENVSDEEQENVSDEEQENMSDEEQENMSDEEQENMSDEEEQSAKNDIGQKKKMTKQKTEGKNRKNVIKKKKKSKEKTEESKTNDTTKKRKEYVMGEKQKLEQRTNLKFLVGLKKTATESCALLKQVYKDKAMSRACVFHWHKRFSEGHDNVEDEKRSGRPVTANTPENVSKIVEKVKADNKVSIRSLAKAININKETVRKIVCKELNMVKVGEQLVPKKQRNKFLKKQREELGNSSSEIQTKPKRQKKSKVVQNSEEPKEPNKNMCGNQDYPTLTPADHPYAETQKDNLYTGNLKDDTYLGKPNTNLYVSNQTNNLYTHKLKNNTYTSNPINNPYIENPKNTPCTTNNAINNVYTEKVKDNTYPGKPPDSNPYPVYPYTGTGYANTGYPCTSFSY